MCENSSHPPHTPRAGLIAGVVRTLAAASLLALSATGCVANPTPHPEKPSYGGGIDAPSEGAENRGGELASDKATGAPDQSDDMFAGESPAPADPSTDVDGDGFSNAGGSWSPGAMPELEPESDRVDDGSIFSEKKPLDDNDESPRVHYLDDDDGDLAG